MTWVNLEDIMMNAVRQSLKDDYSIRVHLPEVVRQNHRDREEKGGCQGLGGGEDGESLFNGSRISV